MRLSNKKRKGSLSLSMNAIVILILAIAMLGLGLTFIRGIFTGITAKVEEAVSAGEVINPPTRDNPVTITPSSVEMRVDQTREVTLAFLNKLPDRKDCKLKITQPGATPVVRNSGSCIACLSADDILFSSACLKLDKDQINLYYISIDATNIDADTYHTTFVVQCYASATPPACTGTPEGIYTKDLVMFVNP